MELAIVDANLQLPHVCRYILQTHFSLPFLELRFYGDNNIWVVIILKLLQGEHLQVLLGIACIKCYEAEK